MINHQHATPPPPNKIKGRRSISKWRVGKRLRTTYINPTLNIQNSYDISTWKGWALNKGIWHGKIYGITWECEVINEGAISTKILIPTNNHNNCPRYQA